MQTLAGYFQPDAPNARARVMTDCLGSVELTLLTDMLEGDFPYYQVRLLREFGLSREIVLAPCHLVDCLFVEAGSSGVRQLNFLLHNSQFNLLPGNYTLELLYNDKLVLSRSLVVPPRPWA